VPALRRKLDATTSSAVSANLFSPLAVFVDAAQVEGMRSLVESIAAVVQLPRFQQIAIDQAPPIARHDPLSRGVFTGFDFHLGDSGPQLIEINTNAGGAFLNVAVHEHQQDCCPAISDHGTKTSTAALEAEILGMFLDEWRLARGSRPLRSIAIIDENPEAQFLFPEFLLAKEMFAAHGMRVSILDPSELEIRGETLLARGEDVDLVYNRLTDFYFEDPRHLVLREAYLRDLAVVTPHPRAHALWADKGNLVLLSDADFLRSLDVPQPRIDLLSRGIPRTLPVEGSHERWWQERKQWFFKPRRGYGSRGTYRGDKLTRRVFSEIMAGDYVAQRFAAPGERLGGTGVGNATFKFDLRCYAYGPRIQLLAARLFQGQTTNFRTVGGGFAPVCRVGQPVPG
jgi:hypothetical protein